MKKWLKGIALCLAIILLCSAFGGDSMPFAPPVTEPVMGLPSLPTEPTDPPASEPPVTEPPVSEPPTETTGPAAPPEYYPPEPPFSTAVTVGSYIPGITAQKAFVYDFDTRSFLYMKGEADAKVYPASITKLMNAYTAVQLFEPDDVLTMDRDTYNITPKDTSLAGIYAGNQMTFRTALQAMLIPSGSDAAHLIAVSGGRKLAGDPTMGAQAAEDRFVEEMNRQVELLGLANTHFVHADGYQNYYHYTCMADLAIIARAVIEIPLIRDTVKMPSMTLTLLNNSETATRISTNLMLRPTRYYHEEACGMKTGTTTAAGSCLLSLFKTGERYVLIGVFHADSNYARYDNAEILFQKFVKGNPPVVPEPPVEPDVSEPPVSEPPVSEPPVSEPPVSEPPVSEPPVSEPPVSEPPVSEPPVSEPPVSEPPVSEPPVQETETSENTETT